MAAGGGSNRCAHGLPLYHLNTLARHILLTLAARHNDGHDRYANMTPSREVAVLVINTS